jgi:hypothetical protein
MRRAQTRRLHRTRLGAVHCVACCRPAAAPCAAGYAWGEDGSNRCPASYYAIDNEAACERAAKAAGKAYFDSWTDPSSPSGCFFDRRYGGFVFNADAVGAGYPGTQLLCSGAARPRTAAWGTIGYYGVHKGYYGGTQVCRIGAQGGARRRARVGLARPLCLGLRAAAKPCNGCCGYSTDRRRHSSGTAEAVHFVRALVSRTRPRAGLTCGQRKHMRRALRDCECGCSHPSANRHPDHAVNVCAGRCSPVAAAVGQRTQAAIDRRAAYAATAVPRSRTRGKRR